MHITEPGYTFYFFIRYMIYRLHFCFELEKNIDHNLSHCNITDSILINSYIFFEIMIHFSYQKILTSSPTLILFALH